jgi:uncharacterized membrane protein YhiD involved in acid resistance
VLALGILIGLERQLRGSPAGLRTAAQILRWRRVL